MRHREIEERLRKKLLWRRIIMGVLALVLLILGSVCSSLYESTKEVVVQEFESELFGVYQTREIIYNQAYVPFMIIGFLGSFSAFVFLVGDLISCRFDTVEINGYYITVYRGAVGHFVYVDGEERGRLIWYGHYVETTLPDGTVVTLSFGRNLIDWCHISFSNGRPSIDL